MSLHTARLLAVVLALTSAFAQTGCVSPRGETTDHRRAAAQQMRADALNTFFAKNPQMRGTLEKAAGYGVFQGVATQTVFLSSGQGWGIIRDNATGKDTYMSAVKLGGGLGVGVADVRAVVVFHDPQVMRNMIDHGWGATGKADAAAKVGDNGDAKSMVITLPGMSIYRFTENGAMLGGAVEGVKIWKDEDLN